MYNAFVYMEKVRAYVERNMNNMIPEAWRTRNPEKFQVKIKKLIFLVWPCLKKTKKICSVFCVCCNLLQKKKRLLWIWPSIFVAPRQ